MKPYEVPPILFLVFRRPDTTQKVFDVIRAVRPKKLFVGADGPNETRPGELEKVAAVRKIVQAVDWDCEVKYLFQEKNVGSKIAESTAISFFFEHVEEGIILEDDCLPDVSFFSYCAELLEHYRNDTRIMHISGANFLYGKKIGVGSYYFSQFASGWGWASWSRAWKLHDPNMKNYPEFKAQKQINNIISSRQIRYQFSRYFEDAFKRKVDAWDIPWVYTILSNHGLCISPNINLVKNIGFGIDSTYCSDSSAVVAGIKTRSMSEMIHPQFIVHNIEADKAVFYRFHQPMHIHAVAEIVRLLFPKWFYAWCVRSYLFFERLISRPSTHSG